MGAGITGALRRFLVSAAVAAQFVCLLGPPVGKALLECLPGVGEL
jgi:hypothetical protein